MDVDVLTGYIYTGIYWRFLHIYHKKTSDLQRHIFFLDKHYIMLLFGGASIRCSIELNNSDSETLHLDKNMFIIIIRDLICINRFFK